MMNGGCRAQIMLWDSRASSECDYQPCTPKTSWFFKKQPYGVSDAIANYAQAECIQSAGQSRTYSLNVLPHITSAIHTSTQHGGTPRPAPLTTATGRA